VTISSTHQATETESDLLNSLYIEALRKGHAIWFRVVSGSMRPILRVGDAVHIQPVVPEDLQIGDIAAFETPAGLVVHRIVHILRPRESPSRFIEMGDIGLQASEMTGEVIAGRVSAIRRGELLVDLQKPLAKRWEGVTARLRYRLYCLYTGSRYQPVRVVLRKSARLVARAGVMVHRIAILADK
jgi:hypothetical protein